MGTGPADHRRSAGRRLSPPRQVEENAVTLKRFFKEKDRIRLQPANANYPPQFYDDVSWTKGKHNLQFGANVRIIRNNRRGNANNITYAVTDPFSLIPSGIAGTGTSLDPDVATLPGGTTPYPLVDGNFTESYDFAATAFAPASAANVAIGFDILGFSVDVLGDRCTVARTDKPAFCFQGHPEASPGLCGSSHGGRDSVTRDEFVRDLLLRCTVAWTGRHGNTC